MLQFYLHLHQHFDLISKVNLYLCASSRGCEMWQREGEVTDSLGIWGWKFLPWFGLLKVSPHESIIHLSAEHTCRHMSQLALTCVVQALWHDRKQTWLSELIITSLFKGLAVHTPSTAHHKVHPWWVCSKASSIFSLSC